MTDEQLEKIAYLNRAFHADNKIKALEATRKQNKSIAERCTASYENSGGSSGSHDNSQERILHQICDDDMKITQMFHDLVECRRDIQNAIACVQNDELETILNMRYLAYMSVQQIADELHYDKRTILRKHLKAIDQIAIKSCH
ncbi:MAG: DUF1492 domain-containing protein [Oscillospiraceae bacterium]|nr:DUF1492 domain-containing protein [Oscillospiraceae bacterium]